MPSFLARETNAAPMPCLKLGNERKVTDFKELQNLFALEEVSQDFVDHSAHLKQAVVCTLFRAQQESRIKLSWLDSYDALERHLNLPEKTSKMVVNQIMDDICQNQARAACEYLAEKVSTCSYLKEELHNAAYDAVIAGCTVIIRKELRFSNLYNLLLQYTNLAAHAERIFVGPVKLPHFVDFSLQIPNPFLDNIDNDLEPLFTGAFGKVFVRDVPVDSPLGLPPGETLFKIPHSSARPRQSLKGEIHTYKHLSYENTVKMEGYGESEDEIYMALFFYRRGSLQKAFDDGHEFNWNTTLKILYDIAFAVHQIHTHYFDPQYIHGDLKPDNILLTEDYHAIICDFGLQTAVGDLIPRGCTEYDDVYASQTTFQWEVYTLGALITRMVTNIRLPQGKEDRRELQTRTAELASVEYSYEHVQQIILDRLKHDDGYSQDKACKLIRLSRQCMGPKDERPFPFMVANVLHKLIHE
ncbi:hypothetical protein ACH5RR_014757 [Cinchona calisaya]|uniref:Protein kinase domain-containing protein n=1 Tax=Cinchona calisaya TaxID=153742 RepID=A0ABD2ZRM0_9GENT